MSSPATPEPTSEAKSSSKQPKEKSQRLKAYTGWYHPCRLWVVKFGQLCARMECAIWRHNTETAFYLYLCCLWTALLVFACISLPLLLPRFYDTSEDHCAPDGSFTLESFSLLDPAWTFQVVIGFGSLDFTVVKTIDIVWDVVVGRAGKTLLAYITWKTFSKYLASGMRTTGPVTYQTFWTIFVQDGPSLLSIFCTIRDFTRRRGPRSKIAMFFIILAMTFVLIFPTLVSSMTGYSSSNQAMVKIDIVTQVPFSKFKRAMYLIHDGSRVNQTPEYAVVDQNSACGTSFCVSDYITKYGVSMPRRSVWKDILLDPPTLNIKSYCDDGLWGNNVSEKGPFVYENKIYGPEYFTNDRAVCQPVVEPNQHQQKYQWGFSIIQVEITLCLLIIWTFGISIMWATAQLRLPTVGRAYSALGKYKSARSLADAMHEEFKEKRHQDINFLTEREIKLCIKMHLDGGKVIMQSSPPFLEQSGWKLIRKWIKANQARTVAIPTLALGTLGLAAPFIVTTSGRSE